MSSTCVRTLRRRTASIIVISFRRALTTAVCLYGLMPTPAAASAPPMPALSTDPTAVPSSDHLLAATPGDLMHWLHAALPLPVSPEERAHILRTLPQEGEVTDLAPAEREKLRALTPLLQIARRDSVYIIKVVVAKQAAVGLHARTVVLISREALRLLTADELQASVAHEIGHDYVWTAFARASRLGDAARLRDLELVCDVVAIATLRALGLEASLLISGLEKLSRFNRQRFGDAVNERHYPTLARRRALARQLSARLRQMSCNDLALRNVL